MQIKTPTQRAYYPASRNEPDYLLCWIPVEELERMVQEGHISPDVPEDYPDGLEVEVSGAGFDEFGIDFGVNPQAIREAYAHLLAQDQLPESGMVHGASLEREAQLLEEAPVGAPKGILSGPTTRGGEPSESFGARPKLPEPHMTDGEDPRTVMLDLK
jgi:hypothetical protein